MLYFNPPDFSLFLTRAAWEYGYPEPGKGADARIFQIQLSAGVTFLTLSLDALMYARENKSKLQFLFFLYLYNVS